METLSLSFFVLLLAGRRGARPNALAPGREEPTQAASIFGSAADSDRRELSRECSPGLAASSGIAALSPALFTLVAAQHLEPDTRYVSPAVR